MCRQGLTSTWGHGYGPETYHELPNDSIRASVHRAVKCDHRGRLVQASERGGVRVERLVEMRDESPRNIIESAHSVNSFLRRLTKNIS